MDSSLQPIQENWMDIMLTTYKQHCTNRAHSSSRRNNLANHMPEVDWNDPDYHLTPFFKVNHKQCTIMDKADKITWTHDITINTTREHIDDGTICPWRIT